jgi:hypothetical protein|tara:strand:- start:507 stop:734 length:228 start_codon:yes stop_codon:yes gene_type:complete
MKLIDMISIGIIALAFMFITGAAKANPVTEWFKTEWVKTVEFQKSSFADAKDQTENTKLKLQDLWSKVKDNVTQD